MAEGRVLVVEDEPEVADVLAYNLGKRGFQPLMAADGLSACRLVGDERPDLILLDLMLPDLDGREICRLIRGQKDERLASTPILMLTALASVENRVGGLSLGANDYVAKPFSVEEVVLRASKLVDRRRTEDAFIVQAQVLRQRESFLLDLQDMLFHELKNHLVVVKGFSARLHESGELLAPDKVRSYSGAIHRSSQYLYGMAEDMLLLRSIERGDTALPRHSISAEDLLTPVAETLSAPLGERGATLRLDIPAGLPALYVNAPSAKIVVSSLLENAVKYGREGGHVGVACSASDAGKLTIRIADDGMGIPEGEIDRVFDKFFRGSNAARSNTGTGLGLYFAKTLTEAMGGSIRVRSTVGEGTVFEVDLPLAPV